MSWLPTTPYFKSSSQPSEEIHGPLRAFSGEGSARGESTGKGLRACWLVYEFDISDLKASESTASNVKAELMNIFQRYLQSIRCGAILQPVRSVRTFALKPDLSIRYKGYIEGIVLAVLGS